MNHDPKRRFPAVFLLALAFLSTPAAATSAKTAPPDDPARHLLQPPPIEALGPPTILVEPGRVTIRATGQQIVVDSQWHLPLQHELAEAIMYHARPGDVIGVLGDLGDRRTLMVGGGDIFDPPTAYWPNHEPVHDIAIVGLLPDKRCRIGPIWLRDELGGVDRLRVENLTVVNDPGVAFPLHCHQGARVGLFQLYDVHVTGMPGDGSYAGRPYKFGMRGTGQWQLDVRRVTIDPAYQHGVYCDNLIGPSYFVDVVTGGTDRTGFQITNRSQTSPIPGRGGVLFERCVVIGSTGVEGGSDFTVTHMGPVVFRDCQSLGTKSGSLVVWSDVSNGLLLNRDGFTTDLVVIDGFKVRAPDADRSHVMISGAQRVHVFDFDIEGNQSALDGVVSHGKTQLGGPIRNGRVVYHLPDPMSQFSGFKAWQKVQTWGGNHTEVLSDMDINRL